MIIPTVSKSCCQRSFHLDWMPHSIRGICGSEKSWDTLPRKQTTISKSSSQEPDTTVLPSGLKATLYTEVSVALKSLETLSTLETDHNFKVLSLEPDTTVLPSGLKATLSYNVSVALESLETFSARKHTTISKSCLSSQIQRSFHLDWMPHFRTTSLLWPWKVLRHFPPVNTPHFQSLVDRARDNGRSIWTESYTGYPVDVTLESLETLSWGNRPQFQSIVVEPDTIVLPSGLKATLRTQSLWPWKVLRHSPEETDHSFKVLSYEPDTMVLPSGLNATPYTVLLWPWKSWDTPIDHNYDLIY